MSKCCSRWGRDASGSFQFLNINYIIESSFRVLRLKKTYIENQLEHIYIYVCVGKSRPTLDMFRSRTPPSKWSIHTQASLPNNLLRALSSMADGFNWLDKGHCLKLMVWNVAFCESARAPTRPPLRTWRHFLCIVYSYIFACVVLRSLKLPGATLHHDLLNLLPHIASCIPK